MEKTCKTCINLCNKRGKVCDLYKGEVQEMLREIDEKLKEELQMDNEFIYEVNDDRKIKLPTYKTKMIIGDVYTNITIMTAKKFNKFQKKMWKIFFNVDIEDVKEE